MGKTHGGSKNINLNLTDIHINNSPATMYTALKGNPKFRLKFADRIFRHFKPEGALSEKANTTRWVSLVDSMQKALILESARWGGWKFPQTPYTIDNYWQDEVDWIHDIWIPQRNKLVLHQFRNIGLYPENDPPQISFNKGENGNYFISLSSKSPLEIYYSLNGLDPRDPEQLSEIDSKAHVYQRELEIFSPGMVQISARSRNSKNLWSALNEMTLWLDVDRPSRNNLIISELMYNPGSSENNPEFLEIMNTGKRMVDLKGTQFVSGIYHRFSQHTFLEPGKVLLLVKDRKVFEKTYPLVEVGAVYDGRLSNRGERIQYLDHDGRPIADFTYDDGDFVLTDGKGYSLYHHSTMTDISNPSTTLPWVQGDVPGGTPGSPNTNSGLILRISRGQAGAEKSLILTVKSNFLVKAELQYSHDLVSWTAKRKIDPQDQPIYSIPLTQGIGSRQAFYRVFYLP